jgi:hypothetical protein
MPGLTTKRALLGGPTGRRSPVAAADGAAGPRRRAPAPTRTSSSPPACASTCSPATRSRRSTTGWRASTAWAGGTGGAVALRLGERGPLSPPSLAASARLLARERARRYADQLAMPSTTATMAASSAEAKWSGS